MNRLDNFVSENDRQKTLFEEMSERLDKEHGDEPRESLSEIINRAVQSDQEKKQELARQKGLLNEMNKRLDEQVRYESEGASLIKTSKVVRNERASDR
ncbi:MAG TPA: hypothetical protein GX532_00615 [Clostridia bacterium]|jgi:hypothetical protein|nr:hypothetical protein [Clostridia bacterium]HHY05475.1 hypothetical protein [Clostridia bacterium]